MGATNLHTTDHLFQGRFPFFSYDGFGTRGLHVPTRVDGGCTIVGQVVSGRNGRLQHDVASLFEVGLEVDDIFFGDGSRFVGTYSRRGVERAAAAAFLSNCMIDGM